MWTWESTSYSFGPLLRFRTMSRWTEIKWSIFRAVWAGLRGWGRASHVPAIVRERQEVPRGGFRTSSRRQQGHSSRQICNLTPPGGSHRQLSPGKSFQVMFQSNWASELILVLMAIKDHFPILPKFWYGICTANIENFKSDADPPSPPIFQDPNS